VTIFPKIRFFLTLITVIILFGSCNKKNDVIPDVTVDFTIDINDPQFVNLNAMGGSAVVDARTNNLGIYAAGYDGNGIIIYSGIDGFYAYDRTCPHDYAVNDLSVKVNVDFIKAICPRCSTAYELAAFGTPASGIGKYPLKNYKTSFDGRFIRVWNY
jgi:nitrite reductase/ring-hydroxylating ferredoxin subunit